MKALHATLHPFLTPLGRPITGLITDEGQPWAMLTGHIGDDQRGQVQLQFYDEPQPRRGRPPDIEKQVGLCLAFDALTGNVHQLPKGRARLRLAPMFGIGCKDSADTARNIRRALKKARAMAAAELEGRGLTFVADADAALTHIRMHSADLHYADHRLQGLFTGWIWQQPDSRARYGKGRLDLPLEGVDPEALGALLKGGS